MNEVKFYGAVYSASRMKIYRVGIYEMFHEFFSNILYCTGKNILDYIMMNIYVESILRVRKF
jgi:hypothetical protein